MRFGSIAVLVFTLSCFSHCGYLQSQTFSSFSAGDRFSLPQLNGTVCFAHDGAYSSAKMENGRWIFVGLTLNDSLCISDLKVSMENSNITIFSFYASSADSRYWVGVWYNAGGEGSQVFDFGLNALTHFSEWWVTLAGNVFLAEGRNWKLQSDNTLAINNQVDNISVMYFNFDADKDKNTPFYIQHSIVISTIAVVIGTVLVATVITKKVRRMDGN